MYSFPLQRQWELKKPEWVDDCIPEIMDGKNIFDFVDPEIEAKLEELEAEEEERAALAAAKDDDVMDDPEEAEAARKVGAWAKAIRKRKGVIKEKARVERKNNHPTMARSVTARGKTITQFVEHMDQLGVKTNADALPNLRGRAVSRGSAKEMEVSHCLHMPPTIRTLRPFLPSPASLAILFSYLACVCLPLILSSSQALSV